MPVAAPVYQYSTLTAAEQARLASSVISASSADALGTGHLAELERAVAGRVRRAAAVAVDSGSAALALAVRGLGIHPGHEVIIPEVGWVSIGTAATDSGAAVRVAPVTETLTPGWEQIEPLITPATAAVILAHLRGRPAPGTEQITAELSARGIALIEDCAQAWGVTTDGRPAGAWGTAAAFSTQAYKMISTGEGGLLLADDSTFLGMIRALAGDTRQRAGAAVWRGKHRMTEVSAAVARPQLAHLDTLTAALRPLQRRIVQILTASGSIRAVLPAPADIPAGNGSLVGLWLSTPEQARQLADAYYQAGLRSWWPGPGDLHTAAAWPAQPSQNIADVRCYLDLQIPWLPDDQHPGFATTVASVTAGTLDQCAA
ncbi:MAG: aminotransferase class I/II-fold pyridoxal phosphate-dependent enzyme [Streptosporangiaceae bacterium]|jgi:dTDP-4-amino-4,6-dideoxygalactose transaminase